MAGKKHRHHAEFVEPDLPITPMLDMTFQLLSFFIFTFKPQNREGMIFITLPEDQGGGASIPDPTDQTPKPVIIIFEVQVSDDRNIGQITMRIEDRNAGAAGKGGAKTPINDLAVFRQTLVDKYKLYKDQNQVAKVQLEIAGKLPWTHTVRLVDLAKQAGFNDVAPTILGRGG